MSFVWYKNLDRSFFRIALSRPEFYRSNRWAISLLSPILLFYCDLDFNINDTVSLKFYMFRRVYEEVKAFYRLLSVAAIRLWRLDSSIFRYYSKIKNSVNLYIIFRWVFHNYIKNVGGCLLWSILIRPINVCRHSILLLYFFFPDTRDLLSPNRTLPWVCHCQRLRLRLF